MINNSFSSRRSNHKKAIDGIINTPARPLFGSRPVNRRPVLAADFQSARRRVGDFDRPNGYHAANRMVGHGGAAGRQSLVAPGNVTPPAGASMLQSTLPGAKRAPANGKKVHSRASSHHKGHGFRKWSLRSAAAFAVLVVLVGGFLFTKGYFQLKHVFKGGGSAAALTSDVNPSKLKGEGDGRINILLLGNGGQGHEGPDLTDTIMVVSIDPVNNKAALLSVPRDLYVKMPVNYIGSSQKINAAYESGKYGYLGRQDASNANQNAINAGFKSADKAVQQVLGIPIHYNAVVDFQAFRQAIDTVGGVTVNVPTQLYDPTMAWENNHNPIIAPAGTQVMNGVKALQYVRSRETTSDFSRTERQRSVMLALKSKMLTLGTVSNPVKISKLMSAFGDNVRTDISLNDAQAMYNLFKKISNGNIQSVGLTNTNGSNNLVTTANLNGTSVVEPTAGLYDYSQIQTYVRSTLKDGYLAKENANVTVLNGSGVPGAATEMADTLKSYGYNVGTVSDAPTQAYEHTILVDLSHGKDKYTKNYLQKRLNTTAVTKLPDASIQPGTANFVIILGQDETTSN